MMKARHDRSSVRRVGPGVCHRTPLDGCSYGRHMSGHNRGIMLVLRACVRVAVAALTMAAASAHAQEPAYFVTYDHYLEEPGNLEIAIASTTGFPREGRGYTAPWLELEYGVRGWWTTELYVEGVMTRHDGSAFCGWRWENRFRPLAGEHRINPVLYVEYENINEASRIQKEIVGSGSL